MNKPVRFALFAALLGAALQSNAFMTQLGEGDHMAHMVINFSSGAIYEFEVSFADVVWTGRDLVNFIDQESSLVSHQQAFNFGDGPVYFLDGFAFDGHSDMGFGRGDNWWHYWVRDGETGEWESPAYGFSDRTVSHGSWDGWVYGSANPPLLIPEPGTLVLFGVGVALIGRMRRHRLWCRCRCVRSSPAL